MLVQRMFEGACISAKGFQEWEYPKHAIFAIMVIEDFITLFVDYFILDCSCNQQG